MAREVEIRLLKRRVIASSMKREPATDASADAADHSLARVGIKLIRSQ